jgi:hypothetical protein
VVFHRFAVDRDHHGDYLSADHELPAW